MTLCIVYIASIYYNITCKAEQNLLQKEVRTWTK
nr:MAG TPA: hypothetical protein [Caudoviricetes sp.]